MVTVLRYSLFIIFILIFNILHNTRAQAEFSHPHPVTILAPEKASFESNNDSVSWSLEPTEHGITCTLTTEFAEPEKISGSEGQMVWEYWIEIDGISVQQNFEGSPKATLTIDLPLDATPNGRHTVTLNVRDFEGKIYQRKRAFELQSDPGIEIQFDTKKSSSFDPLITFSFFGIRENIVGMADIFLDTQFLKTISLSPEQNHNPVKLSVLLEQDIYLTDQMPGNHLLTIRAQGLNGSVSRLSGSFLVQAEMPKIVVNRADDNSLKTVEVAFPPSANPRKGAIECYYDLSTILVVSAETSKISIGREDILAAFSKHNQPQPKGPFSLIISASTANQVQNWQEILFE